MDDKEKPRVVREIFGAIADRYDSLNHVLSASMDRRWRTVCLREVGRRIRVSRPSILDVGCGTADLSLVFSRLGPVVGCDFCRPMLDVAARKLAAERDGGRVHLLMADALALPFPANSFDAVVSAFVVRNLADRRRGLGEMRRILRPGGVLAILEFGMPRNPVFAPLYRFYFLRVLPKLGKLLSGVEGPYRYLPASVQAFPAVEELKVEVENAGFKDAEHRRLTGGIVVLLIARADGPLE
jgi:demethylmenaquinone methyltransferase/2-methoxy-6-polyprenyl-1,4-benzoquinol methylase